MTVTVGRLVDYLQQLDPDLPVVIDDDEFPATGEFVSLRFAIDEMEDQ